jgi:hypothetical protein
MKHSDFKEIRELINSLTTRRFFDTFIDPDVEAVDYISKKGNPIHLTRDKFINGYIGEYEFYAYMAKTYATEGNLYLFRKYVILGNEVAKITTKLGYYIEVFNMDVSMIKLVRGIS